MAPVKQQDLGIVVRVGLEVHAQLSTRTKIFCACRTDYGGKPNSQTCPVCLGLPGSLPVLNDAAVACAVRVGVALEGQLAQRSFFARKNYFYPDVPKNYQITQYDRPLLTDGKLEVVVAGQQRSLAITRMHLEEDAGKLLHDDHPLRTRVDLNRAGIPLLEIVTAPDIQDGQDARTCVEELRRILLYLGVCDGNLQEGSLRCDANVSVHQAATKGGRAKSPQAGAGGDHLGIPPSGPKIEVKNLNSFRAIAQAVDHEIARQTELLASGCQLSAETRGWDAETARTFFMRSKEQVPDYRYFPDPDLPPLVIEATEIAAARASLPELPAAKFARYIADYGMSTADAGTLTGTPALAAYFETAMRALGEAKLVAGRGAKEATQDDAKLVGSWILTEVLAVLNARDIDLAGFPVAPSELASLLALRQAGTLSNNAAKEIFAEMVISGRPVATIVQNDGWQLIRDRAALDRIARKVLDRHPDAVQSYLDGKERVFTFLVGQIMQATGGRAHPDTAREVLRQVLTLRREGPEEEDLGGDKE